MQPAVRSLPSAVCSALPAVHNLLYSVSYAQSATRSLQFTICGAHSVVRSISFAVCGAQSALRNLPCSICLVRSAIAQNAVHNLLCVPPAVRKFQCTIFMRSLPCAVCIAQPAVDIRYTHKTWTLGNWTFGKWTFCNWTFCIWTLCYWTFCGCAGHTGVYCAVFVYHEVFVGFLQPHEDVGAAHSVAHHQHQQAQVREQDVRDELKGTQDWEFFWLRFWNLYFFVNS